MNNIENLENRDYNPDRIFKSLKENPEPIKYKIVWIAENGYSGQSEPSENLDLLKAWLKYTEHKYPEISHVARAEKRFARLGTGTGEDPGFRIEGRGVSFPAKLGCQFAVEENHRDRRDGYFLDF
jgi:hypothetical protein